MRHGQPLQRCGSDRWSAMTVDPARASRIVRGMNLVLRRYSNTGHEKAATGERVDHRSKVRERGCASAAPVVCCGIRSIPAPSFFARIDARSARGKLPVRGG